MIVLMGVAGAGKGTQSELLATEAGYHAISTGQMLRAFATSHQRIRMLAGELLSDDEIISMVDRTLAAVPEIERCILDGFPRTLAQLDWLVAQSRAGRFALPTVIDLEVDEDTVHSRLHARGRQDDSEAVVARRLREYETVTRPVIAGFRTAGAKVFEIDATEAPATVHAAIVKALAA